MNNIENKTEKYCTGCGACVAICPLNAIKYKVNHLGFYEAFVDKNKCINCGKCKKVCTKFTEKKSGNKIENGKVFAAQSKNKEIVKSCTSGGIAYEMAKYGIENGYKIFGTIYDYKKNIAKAIIAENETDIELLKGSKYIQSNTKEAIEQLLSICKNDSKAKFIIFGMPCQITGISKVIKEKNFKNEFIKVDLFCHGIPSYLIWQNYLKWLKEKKGIDKIKRIDFRSKKIGWHEYCIEVIGEKKKYIGIAEKDRFYKCFFDSIILNKACFNCNARANLSEADVRLGDFWGKRYLDRQDGVSLILTLTNKGNQFIKQLEEQKINIIEKTNFEECSRYQSMHPYKYADLQEFAINKLKQSDDIKIMIKEYRKLMSKKYRIKVLFKELTGILPGNIRAKIRKKVHKLTK